MRRLSWLMVVVLLAMAGTGCGGSDRDLDRVVGLGELQVVWSSLGLGGIKFALTNWTDEDVTLTRITLLVDKRTPEAEVGDNESCPSTGIEFGDLYFNISRDSPDHDLQVFGPHGGEAPGAELTIPAGVTREVEAIVFNHLEPAEGGREVDACRVRVRIELNGVTSTSPAFEIHFNDPGV
jgi:hypothetical protein